MGLIEKSIRKRSNQKLAAEVFTQTALSFDEVQAAVQKYCDSENAEVTRLVEANQAKAKTRLGKWTANLRDPKNSHYYVSPHPEMRQILIGFGQRPEPILAGRGNTHNGAWAARLSYPPNGNTVSLILLKWVTGGNDGVLQNKAFYESLLENVHKVISSEPQQASQSAPGPASDARRAPPVEAPSDISTPSPLAAAAPSTSSQQVPPAPAEQPATQTAQIVQPQRARVGDWVADLGTQFSFLKHTDILGLAGMRALLAVDTGFYSSTYITEGQHSASQMYESSKHSLLRCNMVLHSGATVLSCGAPKPDYTFVSDWQLKYIVGEDSQTVIDVPHYRMNNDTLRSGELLVHLREAVRETLTAGIHLHLGDGPPNTEGLVVTMPASTAGYPDNDNSPFAYDHFGGQGNIHAEPLRLPASARDAVVAAMTTSHFRSSPGSGGVLRIVSLAGGRPFDAGSVTLRQERDTDQLAIHLPAALEPAERERSYRAALKFLADIARQLQKTKPSVSAAISEHVEHIAADTKEAWTTAASTRKKDRPPNLWVNNWDRITAAAMVPIAAGRWYPVGIRVTTPAQVNYVDRAMQAADWVSTFKRIGPILLPDGRPSGRQAYSSRRCGLLTNSDDQALPFLRYAWQPDNRDHVTTKVSPPQAWFWEVNARAASASEPSGSNSGLLLVTGWSHADGVLGYGENLLSMLRAFADVVSAADDQARIQTLYLAT